MIRTIKISILAVIIITLAAVIGLIVWQKFYKSPTSANNSVATTNATNNASVGAGQNSNTNGTINVNTTNTSTEVSQREFTEEELILRTARLFVERYGSYSTQNNFENITNVISLMTDEYKKQSEKYISEEEKKEKSLEYYGISTKVASVSLIERKDDQAWVAISSRRKETKGTSEPTSFNQDAEVQMQKEDGVWKVSEVTWK